MGRLPEVFVIQFNRARFRVKHLSPQKSSVEYKICIFDERLNCSIPLHRDTFSHRAILHDFKSLNYTFITETWQRMIEYGGRIFEVYESFKLECWITGSVNVEATCWVDFKIPGSCMLTLLLRCKYSLRFKGSLRSSILRSLNPCTSKFLNSWALASLHLLVYIPPGIRMFLSLRDLAKILEMYIFGERLAWHKHL